MPDFSTFNVLDIVVITVLLLSALFALWRGLVHEVLAIGGWVAAFLLTAQAYPYVLPFAQARIDIPLVPEGLTITVVFIASLLLFSFLTRVLARHVHDSDINFLDRSAGFLFGLLRGAVVACLAFLLLARWVPVDDRPEWLTEAKTMPYLEAGGQLLLKLIPDQQEEKGRSAVEAVEEAGQNLNQVIKAIPKTDSAPDSGKDSGEDTGYKEGDRRMMDRIMDIQSSGQ